MEVQNQSDNKVADRDEKARQFNIKTAQDGNQHQTDTAVELTKIEIDSGKDVEGALV